MNDRQRTAVLAPLAVAALTVLFPRFEYRYDRSGVDALDIATSRAYHRVSPPDYNFVFSAGRRPLTVETKYVGTIERGYSAEPDWGATLPVTLLVLLAGAGAYVWLGRGSSSSPRPMTKMGAVLWGPVETPAGQDAAPPPPTSETAP